MKQEQHSEASGKEPEHFHPATTPGHDHYHISHQHRGGMFGEWEHHTSWHTHEHNHADLTHSHDYNREGEEVNHYREAHIHNHAAPVFSPTEA